MSNRLRELRIKNNISQKKLATDLNVGESTISMWENNQREMDYKTLLKVSNYFGVTIDYLLKDRPSDSISLDEFEIAFHGEVRDLTPEAKEKILEYARLLKLSKDNKK